MERFSRIERLLGMEAARGLQERLVVVVGLGAVGSYVVEGLARSGIGRLRLVDFDIVHKSNINRQLYALESTLGQPKAEVARRRVEDINPRCQVESVQLFVEGAGVEKVLAGQPDLVVDAIDTVWPKVNFLAAVVKAGLPVISSMGAALRQDPTKLKIGDLADTAGCPLARRVRRGLREQGIERGIRCVYSSEAVNYDYAEAASVPVPNEVEGGMGRPTPRAKTALGSLPTMTGIFGLAVANTAIQMLLAQMAAGKEKL